MLICFLNDGHVRTRVSEMCLFMVDIFREQGRDLPYQPSFVSNPDSLLLLNHLGILIGL